ncbi:MAG: hypothetical protein ACPGFA_11140 [Pikeienuella sp.]
MRRAIFILFILALIALIGLTVYAYIADLPAPSSEVTKPATGVGFDQ